jgi:tetratricopeptide (TPR) repeat protein
LAKGETPKLWCLLGNCTDDVTYYEKAWELSKHSSARAQRDWAMHFYNKKQVRFFFNLLLRSFFTYIKFVFEKLREAIPHFQESLRVNGLQENIWIRLAFCAMDMEDWEIAASAYRRYCGLNSEVCALNVHKKLINKSSTFTSS